MSQTPAGWYADPQVPGQQRYWDGQAWTEHVVRVLFDGEVPTEFGMVGVKQRQRLTVTDGGFQWAGASVGWEQVRGYSHLVTLLETSRTRLHTFHVWRESDALTVVWRAPSGGDEAQVADAAHQAMVGALGTFVAPRLIGAALDRIAGGGEIVFAERIEKRELAIAATRQGIEVRGRKPTSIPWSRYAGAATEELTGFTQVWAATDGKPKPIARIRPLNHNVAILPPLFQQLAARYGGA